MNDVLRIAHLRIAHQGAILRWAILTFTQGKSKTGYFVKSENDFTSKIGSFHGGWRNWNNVAEQSEEK